MNNIFYEDIEDGEILYEESKEYSSNNNIIYGRIPTKRQTKILYQTYKPSNEEVDCE
jgi:hypothetical protein